MGKAINTYNFSSNLRLKRFLAEAMITNDRILSIKKNDKCGYIVTLKDGWSE